jgi:hypothetical protein
MRSTVEYLGHLIDALGIHPLPSKVDTIVNAPAPTNVQQLRAFESVYYFKSTERVTWTECEMEMDARAL